jgi:hypothetical protein
VVAELRLHHLGFHFMKPRFFVAPLSKVMLASLEQQVCHRAK